MTDPNVIRRTLESHGQSHLLQFYQDLAPQQQQLFLEQLAAIDFGQIDVLIGAHVSTRGSLSSGRHILPPDLISLDKDDGDSAPEESCP